MFALVITGLLTVATLSEAHASTLSSGWEEPISSYSGDANWEYHGCPKDGSNGSYIDGLVHMGSDYGADEGTPVYAIADGTATYHFSSPEHRQTLMIRHQTADGTTFTAIYGHIKTADKFGSGTGERSVSVSAGEQIGSVWKPVSSGAHLHFGVYEASTGPTSGWGRRKCQADEPPVNSSHNGPFRAPGTFLENHRPPGEPPEVSGPIEAPDAAVTDPQGRVHRFATDAHGRLWKLTRAGGGDWVWTDMGRQGEGFVGAEPTAVTDRNGRILVFVTARGGQVWKLTRAPEGGSWSWQGMGNHHEGFVGKTSAVTVDHDNRVHVFTTAAGGHLWKLTRSANGWGWSDMGSQGQGFADASPTATTDRKGRPLAFVTAGGGQVWKLTRPPDGGGDSWSWDGMGNHHDGFVDVTPAVTVDQDNRVHVFTVGGGGTLWKLTRKSTGWGWSDMGNKGQGFAHASPTVTTDDNGRVLVFVSAGGGHLWKLARGSSPGPWSWADLGERGLGFARERPSVTVDASNRVHVFTVAAGGHMWRAMRGSQWSWSDMGVRGKRFGGRPVGVFESASSPEPGSVKVRGWSFDQDAPVAGVNVRVTVGAPAGEDPVKDVDLGPADDSRGDVGSSYPGTGTNHGFESVIGNVPAGTWDVYVYAHNVAPTPGDRLVLGPTSVTVAEQSGDGSGSDPATADGGSESDSPTSDGGSGSGTSEPAGSTDSEPDAGADEQPEQDSATQPESVTAQARGIESACPPGDVEDAGYDDVDGGVHADAIDCVTWWDVARGLGGGLYGPREPVTRAQMATFVTRLLQASDSELPTEPEDHFADDDGSVHEDNIDVLAEAGIVAGIGGQDYGPGGPVTRAQMAAFLVRAYEYRAGEPLAADGDYFPDDDGSVHEDDINAAATAGLTGGTGNGDRYAPGDPLTRDQMATFLSRLLDLAVDEGLASP